MAKYMIKEGEPEINVPPQVLVEFGPEDEAVEAEWREWMTQHGCEFAPPWTSVEGYRDYFAWILDDDVMFAYKLKFG